MAAPVGRGVGMGVGGDGDGLGTGGREEGGGFGRKSVLNWVGGKRVPAAEICPPIEICRTARAQTRTARVESSAE